MIEEWTTVVGLLGALDAAKAADAFPPPHVVSMGIALGVGLLVGLERERHPDTVAGVRTFGLAGLIGGLAAFLSPTDATPWPLVIVATLAGAAGVWGGIASRLRALPPPSDVKLDVLPDVKRDVKRDVMRDVGLTTAFALVATTLLGGYAVLGERATTLVAAGVLFLLLYIREPLHAAIRRLGEVDVRAIATFVLIALVVLPVLPDRDMGPFDAVNPRTAWMLVVLVVSLSLSGYVAQSLLGDRGGTIATGLLGGLVSSTATTVGAARRAQETGQANVAAATALLACGVLPARIAALVAVVSPFLFASAATWLSGIALLTLLAGYVTLRRDGLAGTKPSERPRNPTQLHSALTFAAIFILISIVAKATIEFGGARAFLAVAGVSGITDMDAIAMSTARQVEARGIDPSIGTKAVLVALLVNTIFKLSIARFSGNREMFRLVLPGLGAAALAALAGVIFA